MATKFIVPLVMASFLLMGASSTSWVDVEYEDFGVGGSRRGGDADVSAEDAYVITHVKWTAAEAVSLTVCWNASLEELRQNVTSIYLNETLFGELDDTGFCATFVELDSDFTLSSQKTKYIIDVELTDGTSKTASASFAMTVVTTLLNCNESLVTEVSWTDNATEVLHLNCTDEPTPIDFFCYYSGDLSNQEFCFTVPNDDDPSGDKITVCLMGPTNNLANISADGGFSVSYLQYGEADGVSPSISLSSNGTVMAVIVGTDDGRSTVHHCTNNTCPLHEQFKPSTHRYQVCGELKTIQTDTITFYDLDVTILWFTAPPARLQFVFANALPNKIYYVSLWQTVAQRDDELMNAGTFDCTEVETGHGCFGELATHSVNGHWYLTVANAADGTNQVIVPFSKGIATTTELATTTEPTTIPISGTTTATPETTAASTTTTPL